MIGPKISIITSTYNAAATIADCIISINAQTYHDIEHLIIDGGSSDQTLEIVKAHEQLFDGQMKWISEPDKGIYDAWNKGVKLATGDWIAFVGGDDILLSNAIEDYVNEINRNEDINFISSKVLLVKQNLRPLRIIGEPWSDRMKTFSCIAHVGSLHAKSLFNLKGTYNENYKISGDYDFLLRCMDIIKPSYIPIVTAKIREGGISGRQIFKVAKEALKAKIENKVKSKFSCYVDYQVMILKYFIRVKILQKFLVPKKQIINFDKPNPLIQTETNNK
jgi:glycosyltransferase involved in cell wall biosynthesis